jgi:hypothetical protein
MHFIETLTGSVFLAIIVTVFKFLFLNSIEVFRFKSYLEFVFYYLHSTYAIALFSKYIFFFLPVKENLG